MLYPVCLSDTVCCETAEREKKNLETYSVKGVRNNPELSPSPKKAITGNPPVCETSNELSHIANEKKENLFVLQFGGNQEPNISRLCYPDPC